MFALLAWIGLGAVPAPSPVAQQSVTLQRLALAVLIAGVAGGLVYLGPRWGREIVIPGIALGGLSILAAGYIRTTLMVTYDHPDVPVEPLIYVQSTPDVPFIANEINRIAAQTGQGKDLKILLDNGWGDGDHEAVSWPFEWYLRDYQESPLLHQDHRFDAQPGRLSGAARALDQSRSDPERVGPVHLPDVQAERLVPRGLQGLCGYGRARGSRSAASASSCQR